MNKIALAIYSFAILILIGYFAYSPASLDTQAAPITPYIIDLQQQTLHFYWKDTNDQPLKSFEQLQDYVAKEHKELVFAMNGGMFTKDFSPQGLYIENGQEMTPLDTLQAGYGNFYLHPNGVFYIQTNQQAGVCTTPEFSAVGQVRWATQSGPMLLIDGEMHPAFREGSTNLHIRNGVGILPDGTLLFAISQEKINFFDFATYFKNWGCKDALYLDGFVSRMYLPAQNWKEDGQFGVMIAETVDR